MIGLTARTSWPVIWQLRWRSPVGGSILVDGELRGGLLGRHFGLPIDPGMSSVVTGDVALADAVHTIDLQTSDERGSDANEDVHPSMAVLCSGSELADPQLVASSRSFASLISRLREEYDVLIVATPALAEGDEAAPVVATLDVLICVVERADSRRGTLESLKHSVNELDCDVLGAVVLSGKAGIRRGVTGTADVAVTAITSEEPVLTE